MRKLLNMCLNCLETKNYYISCSCSLNSFTTFLLSLFISLHFYLKQNNEFWWLRICYLTLPKQDSLFKVIIAWHSFLFLCFTLFKVDISWRIAFKQKIFLLREIESELYFLNILLRKWIWSTRNIFYLLFEIC